MSTQARRPDVPPPPARRPEEPAPADTGPTPPRPTTPPRPAAPPRPVTPPAQPPADGAAPPKSPRRTFPAFPAPRPAEPPRLRDRRHTGAVDLNPRPGAGAPFAATPGAPHATRPPRGCAPYPAPRAVPRPPPSASCSASAWSPAAPRTWLTGGDSAGAADRFTAGAALWHDAPVDRLFPPTVQGKKAGPGGADRTWTRIAVAPDSGCARASTRSSPPSSNRPLRPPAPCHLHRRHPQRARHRRPPLHPRREQTMTDLRTRFRTENLDQRRDLMPRPYAAKGTPPKASATTSAPPGP
ncbi:hypothetical protein ACFQVA_05775 [Actinomadura keratinilytica]